MKNRLNNEKGFTLIELVMVIVILGILAATAIPKFVDLQGDARTSVAEGTTAALRGAITMLHAQYLINGSSSDYNATSVTSNVDASGVTLSNDAGTITAAIDGNNFTWTYTDNNGTSPASVAPGF